MVDVVNPAQAPARPTTHPGGHPGGHPGALPGVGAVKPRGLVYDRAPMLVYLSLIHI